jgi:hypothetical protein
MSTPYFLRVLIPLRVFARFMGWDGLSLGISPSHPMFRIADGCHPAIPSAIPY